MKKIYYREEVEQILKNAIAEEARALVIFAGPTSDAAKLSVIEGMIRLADSVVRTMKDAEKEEE